MPTLFADDPGSLEPPPPGSARAAFVAAGTGVGVGWVASALEERAEAEGFRVVAIRRDRPPPLTSLIDDLLDRLADLALATWPAWPVGNGPVAAWRRSAERLCERGLRPLPRGWTATDAARGLAGAIDPAPLVVVLACDDDAPPPGSLLGLARAAEWLAREARARVLIAVPETLAASDELDAVAFGSTRVVMRKPASNDLPAVQARVRLSPLIGRPNPSSGGEMMLANRLGRDAELAGLFRHNVRVETVRGTRPMVDLVWDAGKVVVEIDGYYFHRDERAFSGDRDRDYQLMISGFLVLRIPEDEVVADVALAVEKIRDVVALRRSGSRTVSEERTRR